MEKTINEKNIKRGDLVKIVLPKGTKIGDKVGGYVILESMLNANNSIVKVQKVDRSDVRVEIKDNEGSGLFWFNISCIQPLLEDCIPQFKVGDTVIITIPDSYKTSWYLSSGKVPFGISPDMLSLNGTCTRIREVIENKYNKENFSHIKNLDSCEYFLYSNIWSWPNCFLTKVASCGSEYDIDKEQSHIKTESICDTTISNPIKEDKGLIKVKSKKLKLNFKN